jgi:RNA polymerase sigma-70 factor (ECF subfamily)
MLNYSTKVTGTTLGSPETRQSLLFRIRDTSDQVAWQEFVEIYAPLIHAYGLRRGLQDADAADVSQQVLQSIARAIPGFVYDRSKGSFRGWLFQITRNHFLKNLRNKRRLPTATGDTSFHEVLHQQQDDTDHERIWNLEHQRQLFHWAAEKVRADFKHSTWNAFWAFAVEGKPVADVAKELGLTPGAVYIAKSRVTARIRQVIKSIESM